RDKRIGKRLAKLICSFSEFGSHIFGDACIIRPPARNDLRFLEGVVHNHSIALRCYRATGTKRLCTCWPTWREFYPIKSFSPAFWAYAKASAELNVRNAVAARAHRVLPAPRRRD